MTVVLSPFWKKENTLFRAFEEVFLFGSALERENYQDIDIVCIYRNNNNQELMTCCDEIRRAVFRHFGVEAHLTVLSASEKRQTRFLECIKTKRIK